MSLVSWEPERFSVKNRHLDEQHRRLFDLVNQLHEALLHGDSGRVVPRVLCELKQYSVTHFIDEEMAMTKVEYPGLMRQQVEHGEFIRQINRFAKEAAAGNDDVAARMCSFLSEWLTNHIEKSDRLYAAALRY